MFGFNSNKKKLTADDCPREIFAASMFIDPPDNGDRQPWETPEPIRVLCIHSTFENAVEQIRETFESRRVDFDGWEFIDETDWPIALGRFLYKRSYCNFYAGDGDHLGVLFHDEFQKDLNDVNH